MKFSGSFQLKELSSVATVSHFTQSHAKRQIKLEFLYGTGEAILKFSAFVPVLTGDLRNSLKDLLGRIDAAIESLGGKYQAFSARLGTTELTESLIATGGNSKPRTISDKRYLNEDGEPIRYSHLGVQYSSRREWANAIKAQGHDIDYHPYLLTSIALNADTATIGLIHGFAEVPEEVYLAFVQLFENLDSLVRNYQLDTTQRLKARQARLKSGPLEVFLTFGVL